MRLKSSRKLQIEIGSRESGAAFEGRLASDGKTAAGYRAPLASE